MKRILFIILFGILSIHASLSQSFVWDKAFKISQRNYLLDVVRIENGSYIASGCSRKWKRNVAGWGEELGITLVAFDANGDTIWTKFTGYYGRGLSSMNLVGDELIYSIINYRDTLTNAVRKAILVTNYEGNSYLLTHIDLSKKEIDGMKYRYNHLWLYGSNVPSVFGAPGAYSYDALLGKLRLDGTEVFSTIYNRGTSSCGSLNVGFLQNGNLFLSAMRGLQAEYYEIDTAGNELQSFGFPVTPAPWIISRRTVFPAPGGAKITIGNMYDFDATTHYLYKYDALGNMSWGGHWHGQLTDPWIYSDGSFISILTKTIPYFSKNLVRYGPDHSVVSQLDMLSPPFIQGNRMFYKVAHDPDGSGVCVGSMAIPNSNDEYFYIARFSDLGIPFDPTEAKPLEVLANGVSPIPFPNPGRNGLRFTLIQDEASIQIRNQLGQTVLAGTYFPEHGLSVDHLSAGVYSYILSQKGKHWVGRWVKE